MPSIQFGTLTLGLALLEAAHALSISSQSHALDPRASSRGRYGQKRQKLTIGFAVAFSIFAAVVLVAIVWWCLRQRKKGIPFWPERMRSKPQGEVVAQQHGDNVWFGGNGVKGGGLSGK